MSCKVPKCSKKIVAKDLCQFHYDRLRRYGDVITRPTFLNCPKCESPFKVARTGKLPVYCPDCLKEIYRIKQRSEKRQKSLLANYGITLEQYAELHKKQNGLCKICNQRTQGRGAAKNNLAVDHDHETGKIRGLLCSHCNTGLGLFRDNPELLKIAINYLKENK